MSLNIKKKARHSPGFGWLTGFEPATLGTTNRCSNQLSYSHQIIETQNYEIPRE